MLGKCLLRGKEFPTLIADPFTNPTMLHHFVAHAIMLPREDLSAAIETAKKVLLSPASSGGPRSLFSVWRASLAGLCDAALGATI